LDTGEKAMKTAFFQFLWVVKQYNAWSTIIKDKKQILHPGALLPRISHTGGMWVLLLGVS